jgi:predicted DNA-binding transcriptional regulator AlpA
MTEQRTNRVMILRRKQVEQRTGLSRSTIYLRIAQGTFPKTVSLGARAVGWLDSESKTGSTLVSK